MASNYTENYGLCQWEATDQVLRTEFNEDNTKIDVALKALTDKDTELEGTLAVQAALLGTKGNCEIDLFTYTGDGRYGSNNPTYISFSKAPMFFLVVGGDCFAFGSRDFNRLFLDLSSNNAFATTTWSGNRVSFTQGAAAWQMNQSGTTYYVVAFYVKDT